MSCRGFFFSFCNLLLCQALLFSQRSDNCGVIFVGCLWQHSKGALYITETAHKLASHVIYYEPHVTNYLTQWLLISQRASNSLTQYEGCLWQFIDALKLSQHFKVPLGGQPLNDSLDVTSNTQHTWQRWNWQPILLLEASSPFPNSCLHVCSLHFFHASCSCWKCGEGGTVLLCNRARAVQGCSVGMCSDLQKLRELYGC